MNKPSHLVIGSNSFLGRQLCKQLQQQSKKVTGVYHKNTQNLFKKVKHLGFEELYNLPNDYQYVYIISSYIPLNTDNNITERLDAVNVALVQHIVNYFTRAKIIFCSSVSVYGELDAVITEQSPLDPITAYAKSKQKGEAIVCNHSKYAIVRISSLFGKRMKPITFLPLIIKSSLKEHTITLFGSGKRRQNYIHVKRVAQILIKAAHCQTNEVFLAVHDTSFSNTEMAEMVSSSFQNLSIVYRGKDDSKSYIYDNSYTRKTLQLKQQNSIKTEIKALIQWMRKEY